MNRRRLIRAGILSSGAIALGGYISEPFWSRDFLQLAPSSSLTYREQKYLKPVIRFFIDHPKTGLNEIPDSEPEDILNRLNLMLNGFPDALKLESLQLFGVLQSRVLTGLTGGLWKPVDKANDEEIAALLLTWRNSKNLMIQSLFHGLQELILSAWFSSDHVMIAFGYPGAPDYLN